MTYNGFARALKAAGQHIGDVFTYQDYLYEMCADGHDHGRLVSEQQWEMICDLKGKREMYYASNSKSALENAEYKRWKEAKENARSSS